MTRDKKELSDQSQQMKISESGQTSQHKTHMGVQRSQRDWSMATGDDGSRRGMAARATYDKVETWGESRLIFSEVTSGVSLLEEWQI